jgi:hypothetical protein
VSVRDRVPARPGVALRAWGVSRLLALGLAVAVSLLFGVPERGVDPAVPAALAVLGGWDTVWYLDIARFGYDEASPWVGVVFTNPAFFPLLPGVMRLALEAGLNPFLTALVVLNAAWLGALAGLHRLTAARAGAAAAGRAVWVLALAPPALYASLAYTEAFVVALAVGAALAATRGWWAVGGLAAAGAALTRPPGILVAVLVVLLALAEDAPRPVRARRAALGAVPALLALGGFLVWMEVARGSWRLPFDAQGAWARGQVGIGVVTDLPGEIERIVLSFGGLVPTAQWTADIRDIGFTVVYVLLLVRLWRTDGGWRSPWVLYSALALALAHYRGNVSAMARFGLLAFPLAWAAADWIAEGGERRRRWVLAASLVVTVLLALQLEIRSP